MNKESISKLITKAEKQIIKWLKPAPHTPANVTKWIAHNLWWLVAIGTVLVGLSILFAIIGILSYVSFVGNSASYVGIYNAPIYSGIWLFYTVISLVFSAVILYFYSKAINPLRAMKAMGWRLLFVVFLIGVVRSVITSIISLNVFEIFFGLVFSAIFAAIGAYCLFEVRHYFVKSKK